MLKKRDPGFEGWKPTPELAQRSVWEAAKTLLKAVGCSLRFGVCPKP